MKNMPSLEFNGVYSWQTNHSLTAEEMTWSGFEFNKEENEEWTEKTENERYE